MRKVVFDPEAKAEFKAATRWYQSRQSGLGTEFREEVHFAIERMRLSPEAFACLENEVRCVTTHRFPYQILYKIYPDFIFIYAVMHHHRDPDYWKSRLV
ncbi:MAG: type II toxin-antitoxin system RelE/ParE family toxin [Pirellulales bacterium]|nr:type II toxin-antitoxin system RelE/ParE family toxin [Pirellulales bacterium]